MPRHVFGGRSPARPRSQPRWLPSGLELCSPGITHTKLWPESTGGGKATVLQHRDEQSHLRGAACHRHTALPHSLPLPLACGCQGAPPSVLAREPPRKLWQRSSKSPARPFEAAKPREQDEGCFSAPRLALVSPAPALSTGVK